MPSIGPDDAALHPGQLGQASPLLFAGLVDDAAMFPPGNAPLERALAEHLTYRQSGYAELVGPLLVPAARLAELADAVADTVAAQALPAASAGRCRRTRRSPRGRRRRCRAVEGSDAIDLVAVELPLSSQ